MKTYTHCPVCNSTTFTPFLTCKDNTVSKENFDLVQCTSCSFVFTQNVPSVEDIFPYYKSDAYISHSDTKKGIVNQLYHTVRKRALQFKLNLINKYNHTDLNHLLDYGCGTGKFAHTVSKTSSWTVDALEPDQSTRQTAESLLSKSIFSNISEVPENKYSIITAWHVFEHVYNLQETLQQLSSSLIKNGRMLIALPNRASFDAQYYKEHWAAYDVPRHLYHFHPETFSLLCQNNGLEIIETIPMYYDAYYISLNSEQFKTNSQGFGPLELVNGFVNGLRSNLKAKSNNQYSSLIYVVKKS